MNTPFEPLTLAEVLTLNGLNRHTYNTLVRREGLNFMRRDLLADRGHKRFRLAHTVGIACFLWSRRTIISIPDTAAAIDADWEFLRSVTEKVVAEPTDTVGWLHFALWAGEPWVARTVSDMAASLPPAGRSWEDLEGSLYVPIHKLAREQAAALLALREAE